MSNYKPTRTQPVPGLTVEVTSSGSNRWGRVVHTESGAVVSRSTSAPICGVTPYVNAVRQYLAVFDWSVPVEALMAADEEQQGRMRQASYEVARAAIPEQRNRY